MNTEGTKSGLSWSMDASPAKHKNTQKFLGNFRQLVFHQTSIFTSKSVIARSKIKAWLSYPIENERHKHENFLWAPRRCRSLVGLLAAITVSGWPETAEIQTVFCTVWVCWLRNVDFYSQTHNTPTFYFKTLSSVFSFGWGSYRQQRTSTSVAKTRAHPREATS